MQAESLSALLGALYRRRLVIVLILAGSVGGGLFFNAMLPKIRVAKAMVFVPQTMPRLSLNSEAGNLPSGPVVPDTSEPTRVAMTGLINSGAVYRRVKEKHPEYDLKKIRRNTKADVDNFQQLVIYAYDRDAERAAELANAVVGAFRDLMREMVEESPRRNLATFEDELPLARQAYLDAQDDRTAFLATIQSPDLRTDMEALLVQRDRLDVSLDQIELQEREAAAERLAIGRVLEGRQEFVLTNRGLSRNFTYQRALDSASRLQREIAELSVTLTSEHPDVQALRERLAVVEEQAKAEAEQLMVLSSSNEVLDPQTRDLMNQMVELDLRQEAFGPTRALYQERGAEIQQRLNQFPQYESDLSRIDEDIRKARNHLDLVGRRIEELRLQLLRGFDPTWSDTDRMAEADEAGTVPDQAGILIFCAIAGLAVGLASAVGLDLLARFRSNYPF
ncbi:MAG TPA: hypothetical protein VGC54_10975 [Planctomycetota bacterium]